MQIRQKDIHRRHTRMFQRVVQMTSFVFNSTFVVHAKHRRLHTLPHRISVYRVVLKSSGDRVTSSKCRHSFETHRFSSPKKLRVQTKLLLVHHQRCVYNRGCGVAMRESHSFNYFLSFFLSSPYARTGSKPVRNLARPRAKIKVSK